MKLLRSKRIVLASAVVLGFLLAGPLARAAANEKSGAPRGPENRKHDEETLRRYDRNANGKLDPDEVAAMKADQERAKHNERKKKKG